MSEDKQPVKTCFNLDPEQLHSMALLAHELVDRAYGALADAHRQREARAVLVEVVLKTAFDTHREWVGVKTSGPAAVSLVDDTSEMLTKYMLLAFEADKARGE